MVEQSGSYRLLRAEGGHRGWVFCPEFRGAQSIHISPQEWDNEVRVFLFGPAMLPGIVQTRPDATDADTENDASESTTSQLGLGGSLLRSPEPRETDPLPTPDIVGAGDRQGESHEDANPDGAAGRTEPSSTAPDTTAISPSPPSIALGTDRFGVEAPWHLTVKGNPHLLIAGLPGMGKTTCLLNLCKQMTGFGVLPIVFSYHEDIDERLELLDYTGAGTPDAKSSTSGVQFVDFDGLGFNPLQVLDRSWKSAHIDVSGIIRDIFMAIYPDLGPLQGAKIRTAIKQSFEELGWGGTADIASLREPPFRRFLEIMRSEPKPAIGLKNLLARLEECRHLRTAKIPRRPDQADGPLQGSLLFLAGSQAEAAGPLRLLSLRDSRRLMLRRRLRYRHLKPHSQPATTGGLSTNTRPAPPRIIIGPPRAGPRDGVVDRGLPSGTGTRPALAVTGRAWVSSEGDEASSALGYLLRPRDQRLGGVALDDRIDDCLDAGGVGNAFENRAPPRLGTDTEPAACQAVHQPPLPSPRAPGPPASLSICEGGRTSVRLAYDRSSVNDGAG